MGEHRWWYLAHHLLGEGGMDGWREVSVVFSLRLDRLLGPGIGLIVGQSCWVFGGLSGFAEDDVRMVRAVHVVLVVNRCVRETCTG
jgi:hypothetical protein